MRLYWTKGARDDLLAIGAHIRHDNPMAARRHVEHLRRRARQAAEHPRSGRVVPELNRDDIREIIEGNYRIIYRVQDCVEVLAVVEGHGLLLLR